MSRLVFLVEERSMKVLLEGLLPRLVPSIQFICVAHDGKKDLEKSIPRKLKAWREPGAKFVIVRDKDKDDCLLLKARLTSLCIEAGRPDAMVRIACQELESWYFGQPNALARAFASPSVENACQKARFRDPDSIVGAAGALAELIPEFQKVSGARTVAPYLAEQSRSHSYSVFLQGVRRLAMQPPTS